ncbi:adenosylcobalamin-dependent ribonucleoside-diphosphate reductase [Deinococcus hopiensis]|uniref:Vitamin B12-dependent ribonucleotide reductase n=1 Tax=Deinococcus hopiensis KR-140 TaxID=695939 RepID=A0A1W1V6U8_9DEIO|nr:adenosylcobalamin-dependent ribonucleoside-diphosphate reductase [Deinococcus hopiensis]SMB88880.1 ribonucleoside-diphosphate reductase class II [Deinococcus hopiensis KR-140]
MTTAPDAITRNFDENAQHIAKRQYLQPSDGDIGGMFRRIAKWVAGAEAEGVREHWAQKYFDLMAEKKFCPGGRVLAGAGTQHGNVLNCFVQGATEHAPESFDGVMEVAKKLALVTKVGGGNGVNLDVYTPRAESSRPDAGVRGWVYMSASHPDVEDFIEGLMRPPTQPDGEKQPVAVRNWTRVVYGEAMPAGLVASARRNGVQIVRAFPGGVLPVADDMGGIIDAARAVAESAKVGVEPRIDLSDMRPEGAPIKGSGGTSSGPVSFLMEIFDNFLEWANRGGETSGPINTLRFVYAPVLRVVRQGGTRRGAGMATISIEHPDVLDFLTAKDLDREAAEGDISTFNISILVTEKFWQTLERDGLWHVDVQEVPGKYYLAPQAGMYGGRLPALPDRDEDSARGVPLYTSAPQGRYNPADKRPGLPAKWLWDQIAQHAWSTGEPGLIFSDRVNEYSALKNLGKRYEIRSTNPCGEIPLTIGEPCDLGAINLAAYVQGSTFDYAGFRADVRTCVRFLDDVLDVNVFALEDNRVASQDLRRLGLGVMGLADALIKMGLRYDNEAGREAIFEIMSALREEAVAESERLGQERGVYPIYTRNAKKIPHGARRNVAVLTVAPTGTTSMLMGVSSGIEPVFSPFIWRKIGSEYRALLHPLFVELLGQYPPASNMDGGKGSWNWDKVTEAVSENHGSVVGLAFIPDALQQVFVCAHDIKPVDHVRMQGAVQRAFDEGGQHAANSLSKTINLPNSATVADVQDAYSEAYKTGCKGITVYRDGSRQFQVLSTSKKKEKKVEDVQEPAVQAVAEVMGEAGAAEGKVQGAENQKPVPTIVPSAPRPQPSPAEFYKSAVPQNPVYQRPARLQGITDMVKLTDPTSGHRRSFLVTVNHLHGKPIEVMVISGRAGDEANADSEALGRVVSIALQHGVPAQAIIKTLRGLNGGLYGSYNGRLVGSKADLIAVALETFAKDMEAAALPPLAGGSVDAPAAAPALSASAQSSGVSVESMDSMSRERCPVCEEKAVIREEGCLKCQACGYSKCG